MLREDRFQGDRGLLGAKLGQKAVEGGALYTAEHQHFVGKCLSPALDLGFRKARKAANALLKLLRLYHTDSKTQLQSDCLDFSGLFRGNVIHQKIVHSHFLSEKRRRPMARRRFKISQPR